MRARRLAAFLLFTISLTACGQDNSGELSASDSPATAVTAAPSTPQPGGPSPAADAGPVGTILAASAGNRVDSAGHGVYVVNDTVFDVDGAELKLPELDLGPRDNVRFYASPLGLFASGVGGASGLSSGGKVLVRLEPSTGAVLWSVPRGAAGFRTGTYAVFTSSADGLSWSRLDADTGKVMWQVRTTDLISPRDPRVVVLGDGSAVSLETGKPVPAPVVPEGSRGVEIGDGIFLTRDGPSLSGVKDGGALWTIDGSGSKVAAGYGKVLLYNSSSEDFVLLESATGKVLGTFGGTLQRTKCSEGEFVSETIVALGCDVAGDAADAVLLVRV